MRDLFNISTGKSAKTETANFLLNIESYGKKLKDTFIDECANNPLRFEQKKSLIKVLSFATEKIIKKVKVNGKETTITIQRDIFGRLLAISLKNRVSIFITLSYPLGPCPPAFCRPDGSICKTTKSALSQCIEKVTADDTTVEVDGSNFNYVIYDGFYLLNKLVNAPELYGELSTKILSMITNKDNLQRVDLIFDTYPDGPTIKDYEHKIRHSIRENYSIRSGLQKRAQPFHKQLVNITFKQKLVEFLIDDWAKECKISFFRNRNKNLILYVNYVKCYKYYTVENSNGSYELVREVVNDLSSNQMEADTKIVMHVCRNNVIEPTNILIKASDTDILIIMLGNMSKISNPNHTIFMQLGIGNSTRIVNVTSMYKKLGDDVSKSLPGLHAFTGCDFIPAFYRKGKRKGFKKILSSSQYQSAFIKLGELANLNDNNVFAILEKFVCGVYNHKTNNNVNQVRHTMFQKTYNVDSDKFFHKIKKFDACNLPPCKAELKQQILRAAFVTNIWQNAFNSFTVPENPLQYGWIEENDGDGQITYTFKWFEGEQFPPNVQDVVLSEDEEETNEDPGKNLNSVSYLCR